MSDCTLRPFATVELTVPLSPTSQSAEVVLAGMDEKFIAPSRTSVGPV
jgi:hypothetical protein